jgi:hypothetical protein
MVDDPWALEVREQIAALLQARLPWPTADVCALDIMQMFDRKNWRVAAAGSATPHRRR